MIFPIFDVQDRVVGFGGRTLGDSKPKYLNSPETSVFSKSACLYGLNTAREGVLQRKQAVVVEGYTDCLMAHQAGMDWTAATLGTALTAQHVGTLRRYADEVVLVFDGDDAGRAAAERSVDLFLEQDVDVRVVLLKGGVDPCDFIQQHGKDAFVEGVDDAVDVFDLKMQLIGEHHDLSRMSGRMAAIDEVLETLAKAGNSLKLDMLVSQNDVLRQLCRRMGVTEVSLRRRLRSKIRPRRASTVVDEVRPRPRALVAQSELLGVVLSDADLAGDFAAGVSEEYFSDDALRRIAAEVLALVRAGRTVELSALCDRLADDALTQAVIDLAHESERKGHERERFDAAMRVLEEDGRMEQLARVKRELSEARAGGDEEKEIELLKRHQELLR